MSEVLAAGYRYLARGWAVLPVHRPVAGRCSCDHPHNGTAAYPGGPILSEREIGKHPATRRGVLDASSDIADIERWLLDRDDRNIGVRTGVASGIFVVDIDGPDGEDELRDAGYLPPTLTFRTGRPEGGRHLVYELPEGIALPGRPLGEHVDCRGENGYIITSPSLHRSGRLYAVEHPAPVALLPGWVIERVSAVPIVDITVDAATDDEINALDLPNSVARRLREQPAPPRYRQHWCFVLSCVEAGLTDAQVLRLVTRHRPSIDKFNGRLDAETRRALGKIRAAGIDRQPSPFDRMETVA